MIHYIFIKRVGCENLNITISDKTISRQLNLIANSAFIETVWGKGSS
jgi:hypothetical protein